MYALAFDSGGTPAGRHGKPWSCFRHHRRRSVRRSAQGQRHPGHGFRRSSGGRALCFNQQSGQSIPAGRVARNPKAATRAMCSTPRSSPAGAAPNCAAPGKVELFARSGNVDNPDRNWSPWKPVDLQKDPVLNVPPARFVQWKAVLHAGDYRAQRGQCAAELPAQERRSRLRRRHRAGGRALPAAAQAGRSSPTPAEPQRQLRSRVSMRRLPARATPIPSA